MPYIAIDEKRLELDRTVEALLNTLRGLQLDDPDDSIEGNIEYVIVRLLDRLYSSDEHSVRQALGLLQNTSHEFYRRVAAPMYNQLSYDNGDVFGNRPKGVEHETYELGPAKTMEYRGWDPEHNEEYHPEHNRTPK